MTALATQPRERPILFQGAMVRALLDGTKTQTRRAWRDQPPAGVRIGYVPGETKTPYGQVGDRLWVREAWRSGKIADRFPPSELTPHVVWYEADGPAPEATNGKLRPSMFMPRWASRILLEITEVRVERLQEISEADARAEGITDGGCLNCGNPEPCDCSSPAPDARDTFAGLWMSINGAESWAANPWIFAISFKVIKP